MSFTDVLTALPYIKAGKLRALGVTTTTRSQALPEVPTVAEQGVTGFDVSVFFGIVAPAGTPADAIDKLNRGLRRGAGAAQGHAARSPAQGLEPAPATDARATRRQFIQARGRRSGATVVQAIRRTDSTEHGRIDH